MLKKVCWWYPRNFPKSFRWYEGYGKFNDLVDFSMGVNGESNPIVVEVVCVADRGPELVVESLAIRFPDDRMKDGSAKVGVLDWVLETMSSFRHMVRLGEWVTRKS